MLKPGFGNIIWGELRGGRRGGRGEGRGEGRGGVDLRNRW